MSQFTFQTFDFSKDIDAISAEQRKHRDAADLMNARIMIAEGRAFNKDEQAQYDEHVNKVVECGKRADHLRKWIEERNASIQGQPRTQAREIEKNAEDGAKKLAAERREAFNKWMGWGFERLNDEQRNHMNRYAVALDSNEPEIRAMSAVLGTAGGFVCPPEFQQSIEMGMKDFTGVLAAGATVIPTSTGNDLPWPTMNDTAVEGEQVEENSPVSESNPTFGMATLKGYTFSSKLVLIPIQLLQDSAVNIEQVVGGLLGERLGRILNRRFTVGTGANQPQGIVTGSTLGKTAASATAVTYDELVDLQHSVDVAYRNQGCAWMFHDLTFAALRKLKDSDGRPIWQPAASSGMAAGSPSTLMGSPYQVNNHMAQMTTGNKSILFGNFRKYIVRAINGITLVRLTERYAERGQVGLFAFTRRDGRAIDPGTNPIKHLVQA